MSVRIRLTRAGRKKVPHYRIVVMDSRNRRDGAYLDQLGTYDPRRQPAQLTVDENKALKWLMAGAQPSDTVRSLLSRQGILLQFDLMKRDTPPEVVAEFKQGRLIRVTKGHEDAVDKWLGSHITSYQIEEEESP